MSLINTNVSRTPHGLLGGSLPFKILGQFHVEMRKEPKLPVFFIFYLRRPNPEVLPEPRRSASLHLRAFS